MRPGWLTIALVASLALNLFLIGAVVGVAVLGGGKGRHGPPLWRMGAELDEPHREAFRKVLRAQAKEAFPQVREARAARRKAYEALAVEPFDRAAAGAAFAKARALDTASRARVDEAVLDFAAGLPADQREALAEGFRREGPREGRRGRDGPPR